MFFVVIICDTAWINHFVMYNNDRALKRVKSDPDVAEYFKEFPFYNENIEKPKVKRLKNIDLLSELPFYEELNMTKINHAFRGYSMSYKVEIIEKKIQLNSYKQVNQVLKTCLVIF